MTCVTGLERVVPTARNRPVTTFALMAFVDVEALNFNSEFGEVLVEVVEHIVVVEIGIDLRHPRLYLSWVVQRVKVREVLIVLYTCHEESEVKVLVDGGSPFGRGMVVERDGGSKSRFVRVRLGILL